MGIVTGRLVAFRRHARCRVLRPLVPNLTDTEYIDKMMYFGSVGDGVTGAAAFPGIR